MVPREGRHFFLQAANSKLFCHPFLSILEKWGDSSLDPLLRISILYYTSEKLDITFSVKKIPLNVDTSFLVSNNYLKSCS